MTCIVGVVHQNRTWMGGDSAWTDGGSFIDKIGAVEPKVARKKAGDSTLLFSGSGSARMVQCILRTFEFPTLPVGRDKADLLSWLVGDVVPGLKKVVVEEGLVVVHDGLPCLPGCFLVGIQGHLFYIDDDLHVRTVSEPFASIGSGIRQALGALYALEKYAPDTPSSEKVLTALEAAARWQRDVCGPFTILDDFTD